MAIVLAQGRPAIDIVHWSYARPDEPWGHLGDPEPRAHLEAAIRAVGRVESREDSRQPFRGTAFVVGRDLLIAASARFGGSGTSGLSPRVVDFGDGSVPGDSALVEVIEVLHVNEQWGCEILRARIPDSIEPLRLSVTDPDAALPREVALVAYPSSDLRNDPTVVQRIFRGVLDVKRLLPGRVNGFETATPPRLVHDCSSTGGCAGGPLVDIATGEVVGVHYAGRYLSANYAAPASELARDLVAAGLEVSLAAGLAPRRSGAAARPHVEMGLDPEEPAERPDSNDGLPPEDGAGTPELLELGASRPALLAQRWREDVDMTWRSLLAPHEQRLDSAVHAVGKVLDGSGFGAWIGTAFLVADRLALTASFIAQAFADGTGRRVAIRSDRRPTVDFGDALGNPVQGAVSRVTGVRFMHPYFHVALLELDRVPEGVAPLDLAAQLPSQLPGRLLALIAFGAPIPPLDGDAVATYERWPDRLFVQPGRALQIGHIPDEPGLPALIHDCANGGGSAGGPVIDLGTGYVIGLHSHAKAVEGGFAQPTWELARDPVLWTYPLRFRPDPRPSWLERWDTDGAAPAAVPQPEREVDHGRWTVDDVPIDWARDEPKALEKLLSTSIDAQMALYVAENVGFTLGTVNRSDPPVLLWRELLRHMATAGLLRRLLEEFAAQPQYAGIAPRLRAFL